MTTCDSAQGEEPDEIRDLTETYQWTEIPSMAKLATWKYE